VRTIFEDFIIPFLAIAIAELGDKTQVSILLLSSRTKNYSYIFLGVFFAFLIVDGIAIVAGNLISSVVEVTILKPISGIVFIIFGVYMLLNKKEEKEEKKYDKNIFVSAFLMIFLTEWGDKTQVAAALYRNNACVKYAFAYGDIFWKNLMRKIKSKATDKDSRSCLYYPWTNKFYFLKDLLYGLVQGEGI